MPEILPRIYIQLSADGEVLGAYTSLELLRNSPAFREGDKSQRVVLRDEDSVNAPQASEEDVFESYLTLGCVDEVVEEDGVRTLVVNTDLESALSLINNFTSTKWGDYEAFSFDMVLRQADS